MRCPMMMCSLSPRSSSWAPRIAASVSTRVVSWNDAAEMNDCVVRLAFVMPSSSGSRTGGLRPPFLAPALCSAALEPVDLLHFVEQVLLHRTRPLDPQDVVRIDRSLGEAVARPDPVALVDAQVLARRHLVQLR